MCACHGDCEGGPECLDDEGGPLPGPRSGALDLPALAELIGRLGHVPRRELHCHPHVSRWLMLTLPEAKPEFPGSIGAPFGIPVIENPDFEPGAWELREDGEVTASGRMQVPLWVTEPVAFDVSFPRMTSRFYPWFPCVPPGPLSISAVI